MSAWHVKKKKPNQCFLQKLRTCRSNTTSLLFVILRCSKVLQSSSIFFFFPHNIVTRAVLYCSRTTETFTEIPTVCRYLMPTMTFFSPRSLVSQDAFIGYGGNQVREKVKKAASWFVYSFDELVQELNRNWAPSCLLCRVFISVQYVLIVLLASLQRCPPLLIFPSSFDFLCAQPRRNKHSSQLSFTTLLLTLAPVCFRPTIKLWEVRDWAALSSAQFEANHVLKRNGAPVKKRG